jgi:hypothetical protein
MTPAPGPQGWGQTDGLPKQPALDAQCQCWHLFFSQLFYVASGDHGSLLPVGQPKSKPVTPVSYSVVKLPSSPGYQGQAGRQSYTEREP